MIAICHACSASFSRLPCSERCVCLRIFFSLSISNAKSSCRFNLSSIFLCLLVLNFITLRWKLSTSAFCRTAQFKFTILHFFTSVKCKKQTPKNLLFVLFRSQLFYFSSSKIDVPIVPSGIFTSKLSAIVAPITANVSESGSFPYPSIDEE